MAKTVTKEKMLEGLKRNPMQDAMEAEGITNITLAKKLKEELDAKETVFSKFRGNLGEQVNVIAWDIRQRARIDAHKLMGDYPAEKHEHSGEIQVIPQLSDEDRKLLEGAAEKIIDGIISKHLAEIKSRS